MYGLSLAESKTLEDQVVRDLQAKYPQRQDHLLVRLTPNCWTNGWYLMAQAKLTRRTVSEIAAEMRRRLSR